MKRVINATPNYVLSEYETAFHPEEHCYINVESSGRVCSTNRPTGVSLAFWLLEHIRIIKLASKIFDNSIVYEAQKR